MPDIAETTTTTGIAAWPAARGRCGRPVAIAGGVGDRGPAELHDQRAHHQSPPSQPSASSSSAFSSAAPAAPRTVL